MRDSLSAWLALGLLTFAANAAAHPGHGLDSSGVGLLRYLLDLSHGGMSVLLVILGAGIAAIALSEARRNGRR
jgi:uncharacterized membrane protein YphA (DoxX/SURF4 family)